jgi:hypothetical protein
MSANMGWLEGGCTGAAKRRAVTLICLYDSPTPTTHSASEQFMSYPGKLLIEALLHKTTSIPLIRLNAGKTGDAT